VVPWKGSFDVVDGDKERGKRGKNEYRTGEKRRFFTQEICILTRKTVIFLGSSDPQ
jgi:hypothetical protein